ncbi:MAG TPA: extracellular solute-binding protein [Pseudonocardiaceae bacterium]|nr:extracellular solute-binding protein [Pseudonocardiaceae bacterium]
MTVNVTPIPWASAHDKYQSAIAAGTTPDIGQMGTTWMGEFGDAGAFAPTPSNIGMNAFYAGAVQSTRVDGGTYGVPWYVDSDVLYYRTDLARGAGFTAPPADWTQLKAMAKAMQTKAGAKYGIYLPVKDYQAFLPFAWSNGAALTDKGRTKWTIDTPAMTAAVSYYQSYFTDGIADRTPSTDAGSVEADFVNGSVPMFIGGSYEVSQLAKAGGAGFTSKYATAVVPKKLTSTSFVGGGDLVVFHKSKNPTAAWKLIQFLSQPANQVAWYQATGDAPAVQAAWHDPSLDGDPKLAVFDQQLRSVTSPPPIPQWDQVVSAGNDQMERVTTAGVAPAQAMQALQAQADSIGTGS